MKLAPESWIAAIVATVLCIAAHSAFAQVEKAAIKFSQGWLFQATQAQFPLAVDKGYWKAEGLEVTVDRGSGSATSIQRVISGTHDIAYSDVGTIVKWNAENPGRELMMFYIAEDGFPLVAVALKSKGIAKPKDLEGKKLGARSFDGARIAVRQGDSFLVRAGHEHVAMNTGTTRLYCLTTMFPEGYPGPVNPANTFDAFGPLAERAAHRKPARHR